MNALSIRNLNRRIATLVIATVFALSALYTPVMLDGMGGTSLTDTAAACSGNPGGC